MARSITDLRTYRANRQEATMPTDLEESNGWNAIEMHALAAPGHDPRPVTVASGYGSPHTVRLLLPPTSAPEGIGTIEEFADDQAVILAAGIYANLDSGGRQQLRAALDLEDQEGWA